MRTRRLRAMIFAIAPWRCPPRRRRRPAAGLRLSARYRARHRAGHALCAALTISPAVRCPATAPPNACCGATWRRRSPRCRPISTSGSLGLKVYDCYRPTRAVAAFARWAQDGRDDERDQALLPRAREAPPVRARLHRRRTRRIRPAPRSISRWSRCRRRRAAPSTRSAVYGPCTAPAAAARARQFARHGHRLRLLRRQEPHGQRSDRARAEALARPCSLPPCARAASTIISANGGTSVFGARGPGL